MKFGVNLINFGPGANPESLTRSVNLVEAIGYHLIMSSDHIAVTPDVSSRYPAPFYEPLTTMGWLAATTQSMEIGTTVAILPYRSPQRSREQGPTSTSLVEAGSSSASVSAGPSRGSTRSTSRSAREEPSLTTTSRPSRHCGRRTSPRTRVGSSRSPTSTPLRVPSASLTRQSGSGVQATVHSAGRCATETAGTRSGYACPISRTGRFLACARWRTASRCLYPRSVRGYARASPSRPYARRLAYRRRRQPRPDQALGCTHVLLDTYYYDVEATTHHETAWRMLATVDEKAADLRNETVR